MNLSDEEFQRLIDEALSELPGEHAQNIQNVAILYEDEPTPEQRQKAKLGPQQTLLGLYEGVPLSERQGLVHLLPDKITLFKNPLVNYSHGDPKALKEEIKHTLWHEIAHYYGLDHKRIHELE